MRSRTALARLLFVVSSPMFFWACGDNSGPAGYFGAPCRGDFDCGGLFCVSVNGGTCLPACRTNADCGPGYDCGDRDRVGAPGKVSVCKPL